MAKPKKPDETPPKDNGKNLYVPEDPKKTKERIKSDIAHDPVFRAYAGGEFFNKNWMMGELDLNDCIASLRERISDVKAGKMDGVEATLIAQASTLDLVFNSLLRQAVTQNMLNHMDIYMRLALKAQSQCRCTLETLAEIKNPKPTAFIKQQNMAAVQQVNNTVPHAQGNGNRPNELSERREHVEAFDPGTAQAAIGNDPRMEALGEIHRTQDSGREKEVLPKRGQGRD
ncbi:MAG: hypothetical protein ACYDAM_01985 [Leptospirales bacterium]